MKKEDFRDYFPNLFPYRSIIICYVVLTHILMILPEYHPAFHKLEFFTRNSDLTVMLLYILSGFLITYILTKEKVRTGDIQVLPFYKRRFLRIYPLHIICISLSYAVYLFPWHKSILPTNASFSDYFTPGQEYLIMALLGSHILFSLKENALALHTWTVGTEENFYQIWAPFIKRINNYKLIIIFILFSPFVELLIYLSNMATTSKWVNFLLQFNSYFRISCLAIGGLGSYIYLTQPKIVQFCKNKWLQYAMLLLIAFFMFSGVRFGIVFFEMIGVAFLIIVLGNIDLKDNPLQLEHKSFVYIAKISYGIYLFHPICILLSIYILNQFMSINNTLYLYTTVLIALTFVLTFLVSIFFHHAIEKRFYKRS